MTRKTVSALASCSSPAHKQQNAGIRRWIHVQSQVVFLNTCFTAVFVGIRGNRGDVGSIPLELRHNKRLKLTEELRLQVATYTRLSTAGTHWQGSGNAQYDFFYLCHQHSVGTHSVEHSAIRPVWQETLTEKVQMTAKGLSLQTVMDTFCQKCLGYLHTDTNGIITQYFILFRMWAYVRSTENVIRALYYALIFMKK